MPILIIFFTVCTQNNNPKISSGTTNCLHPTFFARRSRFYFLTRGDVILWITLPRANIKRTFSALIDSPKGAKAIARCVAPGWNGRRIIVRRRKLINACFLSRTKNSCLFLYRLSEKTLIIYGITNRNEGEPILFHAKNRRSAKFAKVSNLFCVLCENLVISAWTFLFLPKWLSTKKPSV